MATLQRVRAYRCGPREPGGLTREPRTQCSFVVLEEQKKGLFLLLLLPNETMISAVHRPLTVAQASASGSLELDMGRTDPTNT